MRLPELLAPGVAARPDCGVLSTVRHSRYHSAFKGSLRARAARHSLSFLNRDTAGPGYYRALLETSRPGQICCTHNITDLPSEIWTAEAERPSRGANGQFSASCLHLQHRCWCSRCLRTWRAATSSRETISGLGAFVARICVVVKRARRCSLFEHLSHF